MKYLYYLVGHYSQFRGDYYFPPELVTFDLPVGRKMMKTSLSIDGSLNSL